jgi:hypothetical protein
MSIFRRVIYKQIADEGIVSAGSDQVSVPFEDVERAQVRCRLDGVQPRSYELLSK